jgi:hypothetical protein
MQRSAELWWNIRKHTIRKQPYHGEDRKRWSVIERIEIDIKVRNSTQYFGPARTELGLLYYRESIKRSKVYVGNADSCSSVTKLNNTAIRNPTMSH